MSGSTLALVVVIGPVFCLLAAAAAYLITYEEYSHHLLGRRQTVLLSLRSAVTAFVALLLLTLLAGWVLNPR
jgi:hypothetical protein